MADEAGTSQSQRRTRSQVAPEWTPTEELVLVNEIAAVEGDCKTEIDSFQKWQIIAQNCAAQDLAARRTHTQCRRKWDSLLDLFSRVAEFESRPRKPSSSYWSMEPHRRGRLGLPTSFDREVYAVIGRVLRDREKMPESEPEDDAGAKDDDAVDGLQGLGEDAVDSFDARIYKHAKGSRKKRQRLSSQGKCSWQSSFADDNLAESSTEANSLKLSVEVKPSNSPLEDKTRIKILDEIPPDVPAEEEEPQQGSTENQLQMDNAEEEVAVDMEAKERMIAQVLRENGKRINSIVAECTGNLKSFEDSAEFVRCQGNELISCLGVIVKTLDQLCDRAQEC